MQESQNIDYVKQHHTPHWIRMEVASSRLDHPPTLSAAKTSELSLLVKSLFWWLSGRCRQCYSDFLLQCAADIKAEHTDSGIAMDCTDRNRETPHIDKANQQQQRSSLLVARQGCASRKLNQAFLLLESFNFNFVDEERLYIYICIYIYIFIYIKH